MDWWDLQLRVRMKDAWLELDLAIDRIEGIKDQRTEKTDVAVLFVTPGEVTLRTTEVVPWSGALVSSASDGH